MGESSDFVKIFLASLKGFGNGCTSSYYQFENSPLPATFLTKFKYELFLRGLYAFQCRLSLFGLYQCPLPIPHVLLTAIWQCVTQSPSWARLLLDRRDGLELNRHHLMSEAVSALTHQNTVLYSVHCLGSRPL